VVHYIEESDKFKSLENQKLSDKGKVWRDVTMRCLQQTLSDFVESNNNISCPKITEVGFKSHVSCYTQEAHSICDLGINDWKIIAWDIIEINDLVSPKGLKQAVAVAFQHCLPSLVSKLDSIKDSKNSIFFSTEMDEKSELTRKIEFLNDLGKSK
jgi:hypothetical protein